MRASRTGLTSRYDEVEKHFIYCRVAASDYSKDTKKIFRICLKSITGRGAFYITLDCI